ncbi:MULTISPECIES: dihydrodipicolinate synthase family protein [Micromonospora]|uniref:4-hydroxy-tetrahydrodipicolinate synthase n=1 Tax=Micromonospora solifontis TaxID=2487138 RepID=A0ABX9WHS5_9ACTN|nr:MULTISPECIES: dihydrodipicolinate synthase family protein [Micromonospora]NES14209.1 4-hydroxy-tetrahydrodipicolinate synthase [Micromonospora sp. PPF5-17B]NES37645.1 4-hydroxy-tetrahydrodipicolinate synthase [Micromonospora solifontis]NES55842.1 4-hydroxy-tetrahydrodipicolinate synthase [Micromonospora sp. PPF5-6]RNL98090.1 4-hydroxy-tetrahydrodipicolinate synthase [Micromonospora solifontis]
MTLHGLYVPLITPFDERDAVDRDALTALAHEALEAGAAGLVALGTTAEPHALSDAERRAVLDVVAGVCRERRAALLVGAHTVEALRGLGDDVTAALCLVPPFLRPGEEAVLAHFARLAGASPVPLVVYHVPYRTGQELSAGALRRLAGIPGVVGIKHAVGGIDADTIDLLADVPPGFAVLGGDDAYVSPLLALGGHGGILASAHLATADFAALVAAWQAGDAARARPLGHRLATLSRALFAEPNPAVIKAVLHAQGRIPTPAVRPPLLPATPDATARALRYGPDGGRPRAGTAARTGHAFGGAASVQVASTTAW